MNPEAVLPSAPAPLGARCRTIAFTSGKGGVGKSNLVLNTGLVLARRGRRVALLDGDLGLANLTVLLGQTPKHDLRDVLAGDKRLDEILLRGPHGITLVPAGSGVADLARLTEEQRSDLFDQIAALEATVDFLLIDTGAGLNETVLSLILASDESVVVTRPEPTALADAYALMKVVVRECPAYPFHVLINMVRDAEQARQVHRSLSEILMRFLGYRPGDAGFVLMDSAVGDAVVQQVPFTVSAPRCRASRCLEGLADRLLGGGAPAGGRGADILGTDVAGATAEAMTTRALRPGARIGGRRIRALRDEIVEADLGARQARRRAHREPAAEAPAPGRPLLGGTARLSGRGGGLRPRARRGVRGVCRPSRARGHLR